MRPNGARRVLSSIRAIGVRRFAVWFAVVAVAWTGLTVAVGVLVDGQAVCARACHAMRIYGTESANTAHRGVDCIECHGTPGAFGGLADGYALQRRAGAALLGRVPAASVVNDAPCRGCHPAVGSATIVSRGISVRHADFMEEPCTECHGGTGHRFEDRIYEIAQMDDCMQCHSSSAREPSGCELCHVPDANRDRLKQTSTWQITHGKQWRTTHGMGDLKTCVSCHVPAYCARCHGVGLPHPLAWQRQHGEGATAIGVSPCHTCHEESWCADCHGVEMPHPTGFLPRHGPIADKTGEDRCHSCHPKAACTDCHLRSSHPDAPGVDSIHTGDTEVGP
ncbi:MAG: cytochrome c3 family protein [Coriobacteriia bacterium]|nr:cytochrome c3 family protein [Coriobacteriia bacterium]